MATLKNILTKLNKVKKEEDKIRFAKDQPKGHFTRSATSTGNVYLDLATKGGFTKGSYNTIVAPGGTAKSSMALLVIKAEFEDTGRVGVYYDAEGTLDQSYMDRMGVLPHMIIVVSGRNLEEMLDTIEAFSTADEVGVIILDSIPIFVSTSVEVKSASEYSMAVEARRYSQRMPIIEGNCSRRDITMVGLTSYKLDPGSMGDPRKLTRGQWQYTMSNVILDLTKKEVIKDEDKNPIGHIIDARIKKCKTASYDPKKVLKLNFYYEGGFNKFDDYSSIFIDSGLITQSGAWYNFPDENGEMQKMQGKDNVVDYLKENPNTFDVLLERYKNK